MPWPVCQDAHESHRARIRRSAGEMVFGEQMKNLAPLADRDAGRKGQVAGKLAAQACECDPTLDDKCARRPDAGGAEPLELTGELGRPERAVPADVDPSQEDDEWHGRTTVSRAGSAVKRRGRCTSFRGHLAEAW